MKEENRDELAARVAAHLLAFACRRAPGSRGFCGTYLSRVAERLRDKVWRRFTAEELSTLMTVLPSLYEGGRAALPDITGEQRALLARARDVMPAVRRSMGRRSEDEDCLRIALYILGLWEPEDDGAEEWETDIPGRDE